MTVGVAVEGTIAPYISLHGVSKNVALSTASNPDCAQNAVYRPPSVLISCMVQVFLPKGHPTTKFEGRGTKPKLSEGLEILVAADLNRRQESLQRSHPVERK